MLVRVTEWEVRSAFIPHRRQSLEHRMEKIWLHRTFKGGVSQEMEKYWDFNDTLLDMGKKTGLENLLAWMSNRFDRELTYDFNNSSFLDFHTSS